MNPNHHKPSVDPIVIDKDGHTIMGQDSANQQQQAEDVFTQRIFQNGQRMTFRQFGFPFGNSFIFKALALLAVPVVILVSLAGVVLMPVIFLLLRLIFRKSNSKTWVIRSGRF